MRSAPRPRHLLALGVALLLGAAPARADSPLAPQGNGEETVNLVDGSMFRGELVEMVPNDHITLKLATGEIKRIAWSDILPTDGAVQTAPMTPTQPDGAPSARPLTDGEFGEGVTLHLDADNANATLFRVKGSSLAIVPDGDGGVTAVSNENLEQVCTAPCDLRVDPKFPYRIAGPGITQSRSIRIPPGARSLNLHVKTGSQKARGAAGLLILGAPGPMAAGVAMLILGAVTFSPPQSMFGTPDPQLAMQAADAESRRSLYYTLGGVFAGLGVAALVIGIVLSVTGRTRVTSSTGEPLTGRRRDSPPALAWLPSAAHE